MYLKTDNPNFVRDSRSKALLNTNLDALETYKSSRQKFIQALEASAMVPDLNRRLALLESRLNG